MLYSVTHPLVMWVHIDNLEGFLYHLRKPPATLTSPPTPCLIIPSHLSDFPSAVPHILSRELSITLLFSISLHKIPVYNVLYNFPSIFLVVTLCYYPSK